MNDQEVLARLLDQGDAPYVRLANVEGAFTFNQEGTTPNDELFNVFGTALTSMCSKPAVELAESEGGVANFYVNVGGNVKKSFTIDVRELAEDKSQETLMAWARAPPGRPSDRHASWACRCRPWWRWPIWRTA